MIALYAHYVLGLATVALTLCALKFVLSRLRPQMRPRRGRLLQLRDSLQLGNATVHALRAGDRYLIVGACGSRLTLLAQLPRDVRGGSEIGELPDLVCANLREVDLQVGPDGQKSGLRPCRGDRILRHR